MARTGLTKSQVRTTRDQLLAEGRYPSVDAVRHALGDTGSKSTIHKYLKELAEEDHGAGVKREDTARSLQTLVEQLADKLHDDAEQRFNAMLEEKEQQLAELRRQVARLSARIEELEIDAYANLPHDNGFGNFSDLFASSRSGQRDDTAFNVILAGGRTMTVDFDSPQIQLTPRVFQG
ncbi:DNA-binding protein [Duganella sp.]|uniref:DNA-binding protein n=1 Tax=Duganella sp. TaxID=1904440 RepID=UPI0031DAB5AF